MTQHSRPTSTRATPKTGKPQTAKPRAIRLEVDSDPAKLGEVRKRIEAFALAAGLSERGAADLGLSVNEAMANVIRHAYSGATDRPIIVTADVDDLDAVQVRVRIRDWGKIGRAHV